ncbi:hypothetical protein ACFST9_20290 [Hymenobacter monticola]|uniref:Uncharacterized protein n=1 Tax=Hymenobacter monticola TaxID=1705399 RepID=A0ABY4B600_9BACT|nr:hypothetical protein [Hymenobacter monticola]UOE34557.1 hypothetical protein MTP16_02625 [Hymenobacter monticola]
MPKLILVFLSYIFSVQAFAQSKYEAIKYSEIIKYKVDEGRFEFGWLGNVFSGVPCFRNYTKNKLKSQLIIPETDSVIYTSTEPEMNGLKIIPSKIELNKKSRLLQINGQITGAWEDVIPREFEIYIGHRHDTTSNITLSPNLHMTVFYNGVKLDSTIIVDRVPAFYMTHLQKFNVDRGLKNLPGTTYKEMLFNISATIDEKSILVFGLSSRYAEIFEIGKLLTQ